MNIHTLQQFAVNTRLSGRISLHCQTLIYPWPIKTKLSGFLEFMAKSWPFGPLVLSLLALPRRLQLDLWVYAMKQADVGMKKKWICSCATQVRWTLQKLLACLELSVGRQGHTHWREKHTFKLCPDWTATHRKINVRAEARYIPKWTEEENKCQLQGHLCLTSFSCLTPLSPCAKLLTVSTPKMLFLPNRTPFRVIFQMKANSSENSPEKAVSCCWTPSRLCKKQTTLPGLAISLCISICRCV